MSVKVIVISAVAILAVIAGAQYWASHPQLGRGLTPLVGVAGLAALAYGARKK